MLNSSNTSSDKNADVQNAHHALSLLDDPVGGHQKENDQTTSLPPVAEVRDLSFQFNGTGAEFFKIWIVNVFLSIITLGIYSAWAKVRTQRYFYANTTLDGSSFEYLADPIKILKGRCIAFGLLLLYTLLGRSSPVLFMVCALVLLAFTPWAVRQSLAFRARYSAWRGVRFHFNGTVKGAVNTYIFWWAAASFFGFLLPAFLRKQMQYVVNNMRFGDVDFKNDVETFPYYKPFLKMLALVLPVFIVGAVLAGSLGRETAAIFFPVLVALIFFLASVYIRMSLTNLRFDNATLGEHTFHCRYELKSYFWLVLTNTLGVLFTLGLFYPFAKVRQAQYAAEHMSVTAVGHLDEFIDRQQEDLSATGGEVGDLFDIDVGF
ncbi:MAG: DUF898 domain-containing protein [Burkholderiales bacterium]|jgi:uncharacterized membrane protein YjgN (DUF898 family)|nr:DUF898 domain-containing protein [Burkholderiales bacterium]